MSDSCSSWSSCSQLTLPPHGSHSAVQQDVIKAVFTDDGFRCRRLLSQIDGLRLTERLQHPPSRDVAVPPLRVTHGSPHIRSCCSYSAATTADLSAVLTLKSHFRQVRRVNRITIVRFRTSKLQVRATVESLRLQQFQKSVNIGLNWKVPC